MVKIVVGAQWGDEGKGKWIDVLAREFDLAVRYRRPAFYDDDLIVHTTLTEPGRVKVRHQYEVRRGREVLVTASTVLACVSRDGRARAMPEEVVGGNDGAT